MQLVAVIVFVVAASAAGQRIYRYDGTLIDLSRPDLSPVFPEPEGRLPVSVSSLPPPDVSTVFSSSRPLSQPGTPLFQSSLPQPLSQPSTPVFQPSTSQPSVPNFFVPSLPPPSFPPVLLLPQPSVPMVSQPVVVAPAPVLSSVSVPAPVISPASIPVSAPVFSPDSVPPPRFSPTFTPFPASVSVPSPALARVPVQRTCNPMARPLVDQVLGREMFHFSWCHDGRQDYTWSAAHDYCSSLGHGFLPVSLDTLLKDYYIAEVLRAHQIKYIWTSGNKISTQRWSWASGVTPDHLNWSHTGRFDLPQPDNAEGNEQCLALLNNIYDDGIRWHDIACHYTKMVVCQAPLPH